MAPAIKIIGVRPTDIGFKVFAEADTAEAPEGQFRVNNRHLEWWKALTTPTGRYRDTFMTAVEVASQKLATPTAGEELDLRTALTPDAYGYQTTFGDFTITFRHNNIWENKIPDAITVDFTNDKGKDVRIEIIGENCADAVVNGLIAYFDRQTDVPHDQAVAASPR